MLPIGLMPTATLPPSTLSRVRKTQNSVQQVCGMANLAPFQRFELSRAYRSLATNSEFVCPNEKHFRLTHFSDGVKHPTQSESRIQPRAAESFDGFDDNCLHSWQQISSLERKKLSVEELIKSAQYAIVKTQPYIDQISHIYVFGQHLLFQKVFNFDSFQRYLTKN